MRIHLVSDLHLECTPFTFPKVQADLSIIAGDLAPGTPLGLARASTSISKISRPVVIVPGNHEYYVADCKDHVLSRIRSALSPAHVLDRGSLDLGQYRVLGCTLWTDFRSVDTLTAPLGGPLTREVAMELAEFGISDFHRIWDLDPQGPARNVRAQDMAGWSDRDYDWLDREITRAAHEGKEAIVVTHFLPLWDCVAPRYTSSRLTPYFVRSCTALMRHPVKLWVHGHTHCSVDLVYNGVRVVANPRGYTADRRRENLDFHASLILEV